MRRDARTTIQDALMAGEEIAAMTALMSEEGFLADRRTQLAVERLFEIVGEALSRLRRDFPVVAATIPEHREVIDFRNVLAHAYDVVDPRIVWRLNRSHLPALLETLRSLR